MVAVSAETSPVEARALRILVVEADDDSRATMADALHELGPHLVITAETGEDGLWLLARQTFDLVLIDEPTEGLAPLLVEQVGVLLAEIASRGVSILLVEQKLTIALKISRRLYVMGHGQIVFEGSPADLAANQGIRQEWLEV